MCFLNESSFFDNLQKFWSLFEEEHKCFIVSTAAIFLLKQYQNMNIFSIVIDRMIRIDKEDRYYLQIENIFDASLHFSFSYFVVV